MVHLYDTQWHNIDMRILLAYRQIKVPLVDLRFFTHEGLK